MRKLAILFGAVAVVIAIVLWRGRQPGTESAAREAARAAATAPARPSDPAAPRPGVRTLSAGDRRALHDQITRAVQQRATRGGTATASGTEPTGGGGAPVDELPRIPLEQVGKAAQDALRAAIPVLARCYETAAGSAAPRTAMAQMVMISDPELGTVIDTAAITGGDGAQLPAVLDDCLRSAIESLALPPLGVPGVLPLQYSFRFD